LVAALCVAACGAPSPGLDGGSDAGSGGDAGNPAEIQAWLDAHNTERANAMPVPSPALAPLTWSDTVAATAQAWADRCQFVHNTGSGYGENLYAAGGSRASTPAQIVTDWASEKSAYTYSTNTCATGQQCGHYTQVVWRNTTSVGCGMKICSTNSPFGSGSWQLVVCDYDPPGNFVGQRPY
jgi:uncharacterized protein YkwD